jgi:3-isopropylmalate dehydratase small subunit
MTTTISGSIYVVKDNIDTDQIIPAQYLNLVPTIAEEYEKLGSYALIGLPETLYPSRFVAPEKTKTDYPIVIAGRNFGCGSSREHAPIAMGAAGVEAVIAESYARIFFRNCVATGELYPVESPMPAFFSATAWLRVNFILSNPRSGFATSSRPVKKEFSTSTLKRSSWRVKNTI